ncbi:MAG: universal stress protein [Bacteroidetes bacterium]|nr:universal stress protein [Bacteroidota bacterium]
MKKPYTILLPVDYSAQSEHACRFALHLCKDLPAELQILHVYKEPIPDASNPGLYAVDLSKLYQLEKTRLEQYVYELLDKFGFNIQDLRIKLEVLEGDIAFQITQFAHQNQCNIILAGTHNKQELREYIWGTHTLEIVRNSEITVLAIPEGSVYRTWRKMLYASNLRHLEFPVIELLVQICKRTDAVLEIMHIETEEDDKWEKLAEFETFRDNIMKAIGYDKLRLNTMHDQVFVSESLIEYANENGFDVIAVSPSRPSITEIIFGKHISKELLYHSQLPILCVRH